MNVYKHPQDTTFIYKVCIKTLFFGEVSKHPSLSKNKVTEPRLCAMSLLIAITKDLFK